MPEQTTEPVEVKPVEKKKSGSSIIRLLFMALTVFKDGDKEFDNPLSNHSLRSIKAIIVRVGYCICNR
jgi:hypothetical protein